jgi:pimeloyl-ACP methyl ester carboxylesterase
MTTARTLMRNLRFTIAPLATTRVGRPFLLAGMRTRPWEASEAEALAMRGGFARRHGVLGDAVVGAGKTPRYLALIPGSRFELLAGAGHAPQSDAADAILALVHRAAESARTGTPAALPA